MTKICPSCRLLKSVDDFYRYKSDGRLVWGCKACQSKQAKERRAADPERLLAQQRAYWANNPDKKLRAGLKRFGVDEVWYKAQFAKQGGVCAICKGNERSRRNDARARLDGRSNRLGVDHDHATGKVRGLLCVFCNHRLGHLENTEWMKAARAYLKKYK